MLGLKKIYLFRPCRLPKVPIISCSAGRKPIVIRGQFPPLAKTEWSQLTDSTFERLLYV